MTTKELIEAIQNKKNKQADIVDKYVVAIYLYIKEKKVYDWTAINNAIIDRWSISELKRIKTKAWSHLA